MKTPTKKKAVKKKGNYKVEFDVVPNIQTMGKFNPTHSPYELFQLKNKTWKWRKRAKNKKIINHSYNSKQAAIKGMKADFRLTKEMSELKWKEVK